MRERNGPKVSEGKPPEALYTIVRGVAPKYRQPNLVDTCQHTTGRMSRWVCVFSFVPHSIISFSCPSALSAREVDIRTSWPTLEAKVGQGGLISTTHRNLEA